NEISEMIPTIKYPQKERGIVQKPYGIARIEIICAKNLKHVDTWLGGGASDPYVRISNVATSWVYGDSRVIYNNYNPVWEQVFYIPVYDVYEKLNLQVFDYNAFFEDTLLGFYIFDLKSIIKKRPNGSFKGKQLKLDANLTYKGASRGQLSFVANFFSPNEPELGLEVISPTTISIRHLYLLITYQNQYGCFELTGSLARLFNYSSKEEFIKAFSDYVQKDEEVHSLDHKVWATVLATSFLKVLMWEQRREWMNIYNGAESWLSEHVTDVEVEERLYNYSNKFVIQRFKVTQWVDENQQRSVGVFVISKKLIITRRHVDIRIVHRFITYQNGVGCFKLTTQLAEALGFNSVEEAKKHFETYFVSYSPRTAQFDINVWSTAILNWFIRYVLVDFRNEWADIYQKAYNWLCQQVRDDKIRDELLEAARNFVVNRFEVENDVIEEDISFKDSIEAKEIFHNREVDNSFITAVNTNDVAIKGEDEKKRQMTADQNRKPISLSDTKVSRSTTTDTVVKKFITYRTNNGGFKITDELAQHLGILNKESLEIALRSHFVSDNFGKLPSDILVVAVAIWYFRLLGVDHRQHWSTECDSLHKWLSLQIKNPQIERELLGSAKELVITRYNIDDEVIELDAPYQDYLNRETDKCVINEATKNVTEKDDEPILIDRHYKTTQSLILDKHIEDIISFDKEPDQTEKDAAFVIAKESVTPEVCNAITSTAYDDGHIELNETICKELDLPMDEIINTVQKNITNKKLKSPESSSLFATAINLSYLKNVAYKFVDQWKDKYDKACEYLSKQIGDDDAEKELLKFTDNYVIDNCAKRTIKDEMRSAIVYFQISTTPDKYEAAVPKQKDDGSFELNETICKELEVPIEDIITIVKSSTPDKRLQSPESDPWWKTALTISYLQVAAPHYKNQWEDKFKKASDYLSKQIGDAGIRKELLKCTNKYVVDRANDKAIRYSIQENFHVTKLDFTEDTVREVHDGLRSFVDDDTAHIIFDAQHKDGSFTLSPFITDHLDIEPVDAVKSLKQLVGSPRLRGCDDFVWNTAFTVYYIKTILTNHENEWRDAYDRASKWLFRRINDTKLVTELFSACRQYLIHRGCCLLYSTKDTKCFRVFKLNVDEETCKAVFDYLRSMNTADIVRSFCSAQQSNGSFSPQTLTTLHPLIPSPTDAVESLKPFVGSPKLRTCADSIWHTAFTIYYFKNILVDHEKEWRHVCDLASSWITEQIEDTEIEDELYSACKQYLIQQGIEFFNNECGITEESQEEVEVIELRVSEETRKAVHKSLRDDVTKEVARTLCNSQKKDGSFTLHKLISDHLKIQSIDIAVESLKRYVGSLFLRRCDSSIWSTALTATYLRTVLPNYEQEWRPVCERAATWISQRCRNPEEEKELYSACDQFLIKQGAEVLSEKHRQSSLSTK
ncbi:15676_t:CDS:2, partial [Cetraspora pellucida]